MSECEYFHKTNLVYMYLYHFTQITLKVQPVLKLLAKDSHTEPILCFDGIPIVVFDNPEEDDCSNASLARLDSATVHNTPHKMTFLYAIHRQKKVLSVKKPFRRSNLQKTEKYRGFFVLKLREIPLLSSIIRRQDRRKTGWWWWPLTSYCDVIKSISAVSL